MPGRHVAAVPDDRELTREQLRVLPHPGRRVRRERVDRLDIQAADRAPVDHDGYADLGDDSRDGLEIVGARTDVGHCDRGVRRPGAAGDSRVARQPVEHLPEPALRDATEAAVVFQVEARHHRALAEDVVGDDGARLVRVTRAAQRVAQPDLALQWGRAGCGRA
jgi:hypothetical protein